MRGHRLTLDRPSAVLTVDDINALFEDEPPGPDAQSRIVAPPAQATTGLLRGDVQRLVRRNGMSIHYSDAEELCDMTVESESHPQLSIKVFLQGSVEARFDDLLIPTARKTRAGWQPVASILAQPRRARFVRRSRKGERMRKIVISLTRDWLEETDLGGEERQALLAFSRRHMDMVTWRPDDAMVAAVEQILRGAAFNRGLHALHVESRALDIVTDAFRTVFGRGGQGAAGPLNPTDRRRLSRVHDRLADSTGPLPSIGALAREAGVSPNTLQRLFRATYGMSVFEWIRIDRLERARLQLERDHASIAQIAFEAGYLSAANFSTAFKRRFGLAPSALRRR